MLIARKGNRVYEISEESKKSHLSNGFDIVKVDEKTKAETILEHAPGKQVAYSEYAAMKEKAEKLEAENTKLKAEVKDLKKQG